MAKKCWRNRVAENLKQNVAVSREWAANNGYIHADRQRKRSMETILFEYSLTAFAYRKHSEPDASTMATTRPTACLPRTGSPPLSPPRVRACMLFASSSAEAMPEPRLMDGEAPSAGDFDAGDCDGKGDAAADEA